MTVPERVELTCETCGRTVFKHGVQLDVEAGVSPQGDEVIVSQLRAMKASGKRPLRDRYHDIMVRFADFAAYGRLEVPGEMRVLQGELWEIKTSEDRVPFYRSAPSGHRVARVLFVFAKTSGKTADGKTPRKAIDKGLWMMKGDATHGTFTPSQG